MKKPKDNFKENISKKGDNNTLRNKEEKKDPWVDSKITKLSKIAEKLLGFPGRMLYPSKSMKKPTTIFNANIFDSKAKKIWFGDIEIEKDKEALLKLSKSSGPVYILYEMDGRFLEEILAMAFVKNRAAVKVNGDRISYHEDFAKRIKVLSKRKKNNIKKKA